MQQTAPGCPVIAVIANMSSSDSEDEMPSTVIDHVLREAVYRGDLDDGAAVSYEGSTAGVFPF